MPKKSFVYVQALIQVPTIMTEGPEAVSFRSTTVSAMDEGGAYTEGHRWSQQFPAVVGELMNDYVILVGR